jgi:hypothetical protein
MVPETLLPVSVSTSAPPAASMLARARMMKTSTAPLAELYVPRMAQLIAVRLTMAGSPFQKSAM